MRILLVLLGAAVTVTLGQLMISYLRWFIGLGGATEPVAVTILLLLLLRASYVISRKVWG